NDETSIRRWTQVMGEPVSRKVGTAFVIVDIGTTRATVACNIDYMDNPNVVAIVRLLKANKCLDRFGNAWFYAAAARANAARDRQVKTLGLSGACAQTADLVRELRWNK